MSDIVSISKALTADISVLTQQEQDIKARIRSYKQLILDKQTRKEAVAKLLAEEAELIAQLEG